MNDELESGAFEGSSHPIDLPSLATEGTRHQSRAGYWFNEDDPVWTLDKDNAVHVERFRVTLSRDSVKGFISTLANYARTMSGSHTRNIADRCSAMLTETGADSINTTVLITHKSVI
jgi:hypothetical protein